jgi:hypothetical protein
MVYWVLKWFKACPCAPRLDVDVKLDALGLIGSES